MTAQMPIRVRIAPSPTGNLHVGTARTALFNYLYAKHFGGQFILRIEDTDLERSEAKYIDDIYEGLRLLGLAWDEGPDVGGPYAPYTQSERLDTYKIYADQLIESGAAYWCYCTPAELDAEKERAMAEKRPYIYSRRCCNPETAQQLAADPSRKTALRFKIPATPEKIILNDLIRGQVDFETALIGDFVIVKSNGTPSYNFAVVIDDITMHITHVIRGEDHVSNTPKQMLIYEALGAPIPHFAHTSMILAPDRSKLSKRHGATAVSEFIRQGYLPEAMTNFLSLLGWSPADGQEVAPLTHFANQFDFDRVASSPAVFDLEKLNWLNGMYIRQMPLEDLWTRVAPYLYQYDVTQYPQDKLLLMLEAVREPLVTLSEITEAVSYFFETPKPTEQVKTEVLTDPQTRTLLELALETLIPALDYTSPETLSHAVKDFANAQKPIKMKTVMWALRGAITGRVQGADLGKTLFILGSQQVQSRIDTTLVNLRSSVG